MKSNVFAMMFLAAALMMLACDNKQKTNGTSVESDSIETVAAAAEPEDDVEAQDFDADDEEVPRGLDIIRKLWAGKTIDVDAGKSTPGIKQFALAFSKTYPQIGTNEALWDYLISPEADKDEFDIELNDPSLDDTMIPFHIACDSHNGYIRSMAGTQTDRFTYTCYWNRKNGHKLFAAFMEECGEAMNWDDCLIVFYDYDPSTGAMTPEPALTKMIEKRMKQYECYTVRLPKEGKDIEVIGIDGREEDACADESYKLKWNGTTFHWED